jgi:hypothetical protein
MEKAVDYEKLKECAQINYSRIGKLFSPALNRDVYFNAEGFNHIIFKSSRRERERSSQILRFKLLPLAEKLVKISTTYQEFEEIYKELEIRRYKRKERSARLIKYWGLIAIIEGRKIKVILRKIGDDGQTHFWSVIPAWVTNKYRDIKFVTTMKGDPETD